MERSGAVTERRRETEGQRKERSETERQRGWKGVEARGEKE